MHIKGIMESRQKPTFVHATIIGHKIFQMNMTYFASLSPMAEQFACFQVCCIVICNKQALGLRQQTEHRSTCPVRSGCMDAKGHQKPCTQTWWGLTARPGPNLWICQGPCCGSVLRSVWFAFTTSYHVLRISGVLFFILMSKLICLFLFNLQKSWKNY